MFSSDFMINSTNESIRIRDLSFSFVRDFFDIIILKLCGRDRLNRRINEQQKSLKYFSFLDIGHNISLSTIVTNFYIRAS